MTAFSAKVDEHGQWFDTPLPGLLSDVFGLKTNAFYDSPASLSFQLAGNAVETKVHRYEVLEPSTATVVARFGNTGEHTPAVTINKFGKGNAIYLAMESNPSAIEPLMNYLYTETGVQPPKNSRRSLRQGRQRPDTLCQHHRARKMHPHLHLEERNYQQSRL